LVAFAAFAVAFAFFYVPRLSNCLWSDVEFTGWVSPIAARISAGEHIYRDFTLPIPPGSFLVLAGIQQLLHRVRLIDELWLIAFCQAGMTALAYFMARPFTSAINASLTAIATLPLLIICPKEIAYDHTSLLIAWASLTCLSQGLTRENPKARKTCLIFSGFLAGLCLAFKSSTGLGVVLGLGLALFPQALASYRSERLAGLRKELPLWLFMGLGLGAGIVATLLTVVAASGSIGEFYQVVFVDGPALKGGTARAIFNLVSYVAVQNPVQLSLLVGLIIGYLLIRIGAANNSFELTAEQIDDSRYEYGFSGRVFAISSIAFVALIFGLGIYFIASCARLPWLPLRLLAPAGLVPSMLGLFLLCLLLFGNLRAPGKAGSLPPAFVSLTLAAACTSLMHNLSISTLRPFYDNNPIIVMSLLALILITEKARAELFKFALIALSMFSLFGDKFKRYLDATHPVTEAGLWQGLSVSDNGLTVLEAARRARELAGPSGSVLVLPEDTMLSALIDRPRPKLQGAIVYVDQYPERVLAQDLEALEKAPPKVVVLQPQDQVAWRRVYRMWSTNSAAAQLQFKFFEENRKDLYEHDSSYNTWFLRNPGTLELVVLKSKASAER
jgi:hypothetical protein